MLEAHTVSEDRKFEKLHESIRVIKDNHLAHIEAEMGKQGLDIATIKTNYGWIKWIVTTTLGAVIVGTVAAVLNFIR